MVPARYVVHFHPAERVFCIHLLSGHCVATIHPAPGVDSSSQEAFAGAEAIREAMECGRIQSRIAEILRAIA
jgi:hypothetical protein